MLTDFEDESFMTASRYVISETSIVLDSKNRLVAMASIRERKKI